MTTRYLIDDLNPTGFPQVMDEIGVSGVASRTYAYGWQRISEDQVIDSTWTPSYYGYDGSGSVRNLTNSAGDVTDQYEYDAFGNSFTVSGSTPNNYLYRGEQWDPDLGLYYLRARYYNPLTGRFLSKDPFPGFTDRPKTLHRYQYSEGDPVNRVDPTGLLDIVEDEELTSGESTADTEAETQLGKRVRCTIETGAALLNAISDPSLGTIEQLGYSVENCSAEAEGGESESCSLSSSLPDGVDPYQLRLWPEEPYNRELHYGRTPTAAQRASVPPGMEFDHDPSLVEHYYEGPGDGSLPGFNLTQAEREAYAASLEHGGPATPAFQRAQGRLAAYSKKMKKRCGF